MEDSINLDRIEITNCWIEQFKQALKKYDQEPWDISFHPSFRKVMKDAFIEQIRDLEEQVKQMKIENLKQNEGV